LSTLASIDPRHIALVFSDFALIIASISGSVCQFPYLYLCSGFILGFESLGDILVLRSELCFLLASPRCPL